MKIPSSRRSTVFALTRVRSRGRKCTVEEPIMAKYYYLTLIYKTNRSDFQKSRQNLQNSINLNWHYWRIFLKTHSKLQVFFKNKKVIALTCFKTENNRYIIMWLEAIIFVLRNIENFLNLVPRKKKNMKKILWSSTLVRPRTPFIIYAFLRTKFVFFFLYYHASWSVLFLPLWINRH